jgi:hypothetical protein
MVIRPIVGFVIAIGLTCIDGNSALAQQPDPEWQAIAREPADSSPGSWLTALELALVQPRLRYDVGAEHFHALGWVIDPPIIGTWNFRDGDSALVSIRYLGSDGRVIAVSDPTLRDRDYEPSLEALVVEGDYRTPITLLESASRWQCQFDVGVRLVNVSSTTPQFGWNTMRTREEVFAGGPHVACNQWCPLGGSSAEAFGRWEVGWIGGVTQRDTINYGQAASGSTCSSRFNNTGSDPLVWSGWEFGLSYPLSSSEEPFHIAVGYHLSSWLYTGQVFPSFGVRGWSDGTCIRGPFLRGEFRF